MLQLLADTVPVQVSPAPSLTVTFPVGVPEPGEFTVTVKLIVVCSPTFDGSGDIVVILVVVSAVPTVCDLTAEVLALKFVSVANVAVRLLAPADGKVIRQLPAETVPEHVSPAPSLTLTVSPPGMVPLPGEFTVTVKLIVACCPTLEGSGVTEVMVVVVSALLTVCVSTPEVLVLKLVLPRY